MSEQFQYTSRAETVVSTPKSVQAALLDERDRQLEDLLALVDSRIQALRARLAVLEGP